jgi:hypothetical protein
VDLLWDPLWPLRKCVGAPIVHLNLILLASTASIWPRIDLDARCTKSLADEVRASLGHLLTA